MKCETVISYYLALRLSLLYILVYSPGSFRMYTAFIWAQMANHLHVKQAHYKQKLWNYIKKLNFIKKKCQTFDFRFLIASFYQLIFRENSIIALESVFRKLLIYCGKSLWWPHINDLYIAIIYNALYMYSLLVSVSKLMT